MLLLTVQHSVYDTLAQRDTFSGALVVAKPIVSAQMHHCVNILGYDRYPPHRLANDEVSGS